MSAVLHQIDIGPMQNFLYLIADENTRQTLVVDPAWAPDKIMNLLEQKNLILAGLAITHAHYDHTNAILDLLAHFDVPVYANKLEYAYSKSGARIVGDLGSTVKPLESDDVVKLGDTAVRFYHTPGHTPGSQCLLVDNNLLTGDTLFIDGCGRSDLPGGDAQALYHSLKKIAALPSNYHICPGHDYGPVKGRLLGDEVKYNPFLQMDDPNIFLNSVS